MPQQPQKTPVVQKPTPIVLDQLLIETEDSNSATFDRRLEYGHLHPEQTKYPGHRLLKQGANSYGLYQRTWGNDFTSQDSYNVAKEFEAEDNSYPTFVRSYRVLRSDYLVTGPLTKGLPFTGIVAVNVTNGGTGYTKDFAVTVSGAGGGSGFAGLAIVNRGVVQRVEINAVGTGYSGALTVSFSSGDGSSAAATAILQPVAAVLVAEKHTKLPEDDPYQSLYDRVTRVYQTLPGPVLSGTHVDESTGIKVDFDKRIVAGSTVSSGAYEEIQPLDRWRSIQIVSALRVDTLPSPNTYASIIRQSFPDIMTNPSVYAVVVDSSADIGFSYDLFEGYSGPCVARMTERYLTAAAYAAYTAPAVTVFKPQGGRFFFSGGSSGSARIWQFTIPRSLHGSYALSLLGMTPSPSTISATTPTGYSSGDYIYVDVQPEKWRFGVWRVLEIEAKIP